MRMLIAIVAVAISATMAGAADIKVINEKAAFPEGPAFIDGKLHYVEYGGNTVLVWDGKTNTKLLGAGGLRTVGGVAARRRSRRNLL